MQYTNDYNGYIPVGGWVDPANGYANSYAWQNQIGPYCGYNTSGWNNMLPSNSEIANARGVLFGCPAFLRGDGANATKPSYGMSIYPMQDGNISSADITIRSDMTGVFRFVKLLEIKYASKRCEFGDSDDTYLRTNTSWLTTGNYGHYFTSNKYRKGDPIRHGLSMNMSFYDGHAGNRLYRDSYMNIQQPQLAR